MSLSPWIIAARPRTLGAAVAPIVIATALAFRDGTTPDGTLVACLLIAAVAIQIATNLFNDAIDCTRGADRNRLGPVRVTQAGLLGAREVLFGAFLVLGVALAAGIPLVLHGGWPIFAIGVISLYLAYGYTGGPLALAYIGLGEVFVLLFFGLIAVCGSYWILTLRFSWYAALAGLQVGSLAVVLLLINNIRDRESDIAANKRTIVARLSKQGALGELAAFLSLPFLVTPLWIPYSTTAVWLPCCCIPLAFMIFLHTKKSVDAEHFGVCLKLSAKLLMIFSILLAVAVANMPN